MSAETEFIFEPIGELWRAPEGKTLIGPFGPYRPEILIKEFPDGWYSCIAFPGYSEMERKHDSFESAKAYYGKK